MGNIKGQVERIVQSYLPGAKVELDEIPLAEKIGGNIIWDGFSTMGTADRRKHLWNILRKYIQPTEDIQLIGLLIPLSPAEHHALLDLAA